MWKLLFQQQNSNLKTMFCGNNFQKIETNSILQNAIAAEISVTIIKYLLQLFVFFEWITVSCIFSGGAGMSYTNCFDKTAE